MSKPPKKRVNTLLLYRERDDPVKDGLARGAFHFFAHRREVKKNREKTRKERREHENQEEQTGAKSADAAGKRRTTRRTGDDAMEERTPASDMGRDRSGGG